jgi:hypothetical protein
MEVYTFTHKGVKYPLECDFASIPRKKRLGEFGEIVARVLLEGAGFTRVEDLNSRKPNHEDADFLGERGGLYLISVKARNRFTCTGKLNDRYKLCGKRGIEECRATADKYGAEFSWLTISVDDGRYSAYFGTYRQLLSLGLNGKGIVMTDARTRNYEALAVNEPHTLPRSLFTNQQ